MNFKHTNIIMHKELRGYFNSPLAYIFMTVFLMGSSLYYFNGFFLGEVASMRAYFEFLPWIYLFLIPSITMRLWAEEEKMGTLEILLTAPIKPWEVVLGKFFASFAFLVITLMFSLAIPFILLFIGQPDWGTIVGGYLGAVLLGGTYLAMGLWISSLTKNQIIAFIFTVLAIFTLTVLGESFITQSLPSSFVPLFSYLGMGTHFDSMLRGVLDTRDAIYFLSFIALFLYLNASRLHSRKWH